MIRYNIPYVSGKEIEYIKKALDDGRLSGNNSFTKKCHSFFEKRYEFKKALLTSSCTDALEMSALLANIEPGDEVIIPSYTFVSTSNAFVLRGAKVVFADSYGDHPNIDPDEITRLITGRTKAIVLVHYAGVACDMDAIMSIAQKNNLIVIEDAAQAIDSFYKGKPLGGIGDMGAFSFHETKNIISGQGGLLTVNRDKYLDRSEVIWEKGTNRSAFFRGEVDKYGWVDYGSSFLASDITAAFLYAQLEELTSIQDKRKLIWNTYNSAFENLESKGLCKRPFIPEYSTVNGHIFYLLCNSLDERTELISHLKKNGVHAVFHYLSLEKSEYYTKKYGQYSGKALVNSEKFQNRLLRLPLFFDLSEKEINHIVDSVNSFFAS